MFETEPALPTDRFIEAFGYRGWMRRKADKGLKRLRGILEDNEGRGVRATVGGHLNFAAVTSAPSASCSCSSSQWLGRRAHGLRQQARGPHGRRDRGHLRRRRRSPLPGAAVAHHQPVRHGGSLVPQGPAGRGAPPHARRGLVRRLDARPEHDSKRLAAADEFEIVDTQENTFTPIEFEENPFAYGAQELQRHSVLPSPNSPAGEGVIQGSLILFKLTNEALANRPLELKIKNPALPDDVGIVDLDI